MFGRRLLPSLLALVAVASPALPASAAGGPAPGFRAVTLAAAAPGRLRLTLAPALGASWREVNVARLVVRTAGRQRRVPAAALPASAELEIARPAGGCALVLADLGPASAMGRPDAWQRVTRASKLVICPAAGAPGAREARVRAGALLTAETGGLLEVQPILNPATVRPGSDLAVRVVVRGEPRLGVHVTASGPGGRSLDAWSNPQGLATFTIPASGRWTVWFRYPLDEAGPEAEAALGFDVEPAAFWNRRPVSGEVR